MEETASIIRSKPPEKKELTDHKKIFELYCRKIVSSSLTKSPYLRTAADALAEGERINPFFLKTLSNILALRVRQITPDFDTRLMRFLDNHLLDPQSIKLLEAHTFQVEDQSLQLVFPLKPTIEQEEKIQQGKKVMADLNFLQNRRYHSLELASLESIATEELDSLVTDGKNLYQETPRVEPHVSFTILERLSLLAHDNEELARRLGNMRVMNRDSYRFLQQVVVPLVGLSDSDIEKRVIELLSRWNERRNYSPLSNAPSLLETLKITVGEVPIHNRAKHDLRGSFTEVGLSRRTASMLLRQGLTLESILKEFTDAEVLLMRLHGLRIEGLKDVGGALKKLAPDHKLIQSIDEYVKRNSYMKRRSTRLIPDNMSFVEGLKSAGVSTAVANRLLRQGITSWGDFFGKFPDITNFLIPSNFSRHDVEQLYNLILSRQYPDNPLTKALGEHLARYPRHF